MDAFTPKVAEQATQETPVMENFLYLFFSPSEASQAAGRAFWERRHTRADQDIPSSMATIRAQTAAIAQWGMVPMGLVRSAQKNQAASPHCKRARRHHGTEHQLLYPPAAHPECDASSLP